MKKIDKKTVKHVANLSRLSLTKEEEKKFSGQLSLILEYIDQLKKLDTRDVFATSHILSGMRNVFRNDVVRKSLSPEEVLKNAPKQSKNMFEVPKVIET